MKVPATFRTLPRGLDFMRYLVHMTRSKLQLMFREFNAHDLPLSLIGHHAALRYECEFHRNIADTLAGCRIRATNSSGRLLMDV